MKKEITGAFENSILTLTGSNNQPPYVAEITGPDQKWQFSRKFITESEDNGRCKQYELEDGKLYNWKESREQHFGIVEDGKLYEISKADALDLVKTM